MPIFFKKQGALNIRMVLDDEKILASVDRVRKLINPKSKKQIIKLEEDMYFKDLVETITQYLVNYPQKAQFPSNVYKSVYELIEFATQQFEVNNIKISDIISKREDNIKTSVILKEALDTVAKKEEGWIDKVSKYDGKFTEDITEALTIIANEKLNDETDVEVSKKMITTKIGNLESNLFLEIDMERIEDSSKALSYIGIELAEALKTIPSPIETLANTVTKIEENPIINEINNFEEQVVNNTEIVQEVNQIEQVNLEQQMESEIVLNQNLELDTLPLDIQIEDAINLEQVDLNQNSPNISEEKLTEVNEVNKVNNEKIQNIDLKQEITDFKNQNTEVNKFGNMTYYDEDITLENVVTEKTGFFSKFKNSGIARAFRYIFGTKLVLDLPKLPEPNDTNINLNTNMNANTNLQ